MGRRTQPKPIEERAAKFARAETSSSPASASSVSAEIASSSHWPGPFSTANQLIANREAARTAREAQLAQGVAVAQSDEPLDQYDLLLSSITSHTSSRSLDSLRKTYIPSLSALCIHVLADYIESVDVLNDLPETLQEELALQLANRRKLNSRTVSFCISQDSPIIKIPQCSDLHEDILPALLSTNLTVLDLRNCGHCFHDAILPSVMAHLSSLKVLVLTGLYRLSDVSLSQLLYHTQHVTQADFSYNSNLALLSMTAIASLPLTHLTLDGTNINDPQLKLLRQLKQLTHLSLNNITTISDTAVTTVLCGVGSKLTHFSIAHSSHLTNNTVEAIFNYCESLETLNISHLRHITTTALLDLFSQTDKSTKTIGHISNLNIENLPVTDEVVIQLGQLYGSYLRHLNLSRTHVTPKSIAAIIKHFQGLTALDVSFVFSLQNSLLDALATLCPALSDIKVWGNMQLENYLIREK